jgi:hypothetical protein
MQIAVDVLFDAYLLVGVKSLPSFYLSGFTEFILIATFSSTTLLLRRNIDNHGGLSG